jgi:hypothetical protein
MKVFLIDDYARICSDTGDFVEQGNQEDFVRHTAGISLAVPRNAYASFQVITDRESGEPIRDFNIVFTPLVDETGNNHALDPDYEIFIEWFHRINGAMIPDLLIPYDKAKYPYKVPADAKYNPNQRVGALWVDLFVSDSAKRGRYRGNITVTVNEAVYTFTIEVKVFKCIVPMESQIISDFNNYADNISPVFPNLADNRERYRDGSFFEVERRFYRMAREHRCVFQNLNYLHSGMPIESFAPGLEGGGKNIHIKSWDIFDRHFGPLLDGSAFKGSRRGEMPIEFMFTPFNIGWPADYRKFGDKGYKTEYRRILWEFIRHFEEKGWTKTNLEIMFNNKKEYRFFPTTQDEIWYEHDDEILDYMWDVIKDIFEHSPVKMVFRADSSNHYHNHYKKYADVFNMWVVAMSYLAWCPESVLHMRNKNSILWLYGWFDEGMTINLPLHAFLTQPVMCAMMGTSGFCSFWHSTGWGNNYLETPFVNGGQNMFYPGDYFGFDNIFPALRLKVLRNQMQTVDLMMTAYGLDTEAFQYVWKDLKDLVNNIYGYENSESWWMPKPPFLDTPPRYWKGSEIAKYENSRHFEGHSPKIIETLRLGVLDRLG